MMTDSSLPKTAKAARNAFSCPFDRRVYGLG